MTSIDCAQFCLFYLASIHPETQCPDILDQLRATLVNSTNQVPIQPLVKFGLCHFNTSPNKWINPPPSKYRDTSKSDLRLEWMKLDEYLMYQNNLIDRIVEHKCVQVSPFGLNKELHQGVELENIDKRPRQSGSCQAEPEAWELDKTGRDEILAMTVLEPGQTVLAIPIAFVQMKEKPFCLCFNYREFSAVNIQDSLLITCMDDCSDLPARQKHFQHWMREVKTSKWQLPKKIATK